MYGRLALLLLVSVLSVANGQLLQKLFGNECLEKNVPQGMCAVLYDDDGCEGWEKPVPEGYTTLGIRHKNDAEAVIVKKGCILTGWDHDSPDEGKRGVRAVFNAQNFDGPSNYWKNLDDDSLNEEISAVTCECPKSSPSTPSKTSSDSQQRSAQVQASPSSPPSSDSIDPSSNTRIGSCPPVPATACAVLYDDKNCENDDFQALVLSPGESMSFSLLKSPLNYKYKNEIESFSVRKGCTLEAYDDSDFSDDGIRATAKDGDLHVNLDNHPNSKYEDLDSDIESVRCNC